MHWRMRTNTVLNDELLREAMKLTGARTRTAAVDEALRTLVEVRTARERNATYRDRLDRLGPSLRALKLRMPPSEVLRERTPSLAAEIHELHLAAPLEVEEPDRAAVLATALELDATACDAVFITLARTLDVLLLTAERKTRTWVARLGKLVESLAC
ncbi:hypothetical protein EG835_04580 [bacterium]|nr:hypothetical protein [bacterium]